VESSREAPAGELLRGPPASGSTVEEQKEGKLDRERILRSKLPLRETGAGPADAARALSWPPLSWLPLPALMHLTVQYTAVAAARALQLSTKRLVKPAEPDSMPTGGW
jgi:hypothetical protein